MKLFGEKQEENKWHKSESHTLFIINGQSIYNPHNHIIYFLDNKDKCYLITIELFIHLHNYINFIFYKSYCVDICIF